MTKAHLSLVLGLMRDAASSAPMLSALQGYAQVIVINHGQADDSGLAGAPGRQRCVAVTVCVHLADGRRVAHLCPPPVVQVVAGSGHMMVNMAKPEAVGAYFEHWLQGRWGQRGGNWRWLCQPCGTLQVPTYKGTVICRSVARNFNSSVQASMGTISCSIAPNKLSPFCPFISMRMVSPNFMNSVAGLPSRMVSIARFSAMQL
jgi:hypothetical protein